jgi:hypothetical protein
MKQPLFPGDSEIDEIFKIFRYVRLASGPCGSKAHHFSCDSKGLIPVPSEPASSGLFTPSPVVKSVHDLC